ITRWPDPRYRRSAFETHFFFRSLPLQLSSSSFIDANLCLVQKAGDRNIPSRP
ncbi:hypothetical protein LshimejAT787_3600010, partial [Lyophyllum shimeji]